MRIPRELIDEIIDLSRGDSRTLASCSLVSRAFQETSYRHLFRATKVLQNIESRGLGRFLAFIQDNPIMARIIHRLTIACGSKRTGVTLPIIELALVLQRLPALRSLSFWNVLIKGVSLTDTSNALCAISKLTLDFIELDQVSVGSCPELLSFMGLFSSIKELHLKSPISSSNPRLGGEHITPLLSVRTFSVSFVPDKPMEHLDHCIETLLKCLYPEKLTSIAASCGDYHGMLTTGEILHYTGPNILHLDLDLRLFVSSDLRLHAAFSVSSCPSLIDLIIRFKVEDFRTKLTRHHSVALVGILSSIATSDLHNLTFYVTYTGWHRSLPALRLLDWPKIQQVIVEFPALESVKFHWRYADRPGTYHSTTVEGRCALIKELMPDLVARGLVKFESTFVG